MESKNEKVQELNPNQMEKISGGGTFTTNGYLYKVGDKVTDYWAPQNGVGVVTKNVGVSGNYYIDEVFFPDVNQTYNSFESNLRPA